MRYTKKILSVILALVISIPYLGIFASAEGEAWLFIDGENINRGVNMAVIYSDIPSTGQSLWGYDVIVDENHIVTAIIDSGDAEGEDLAIPEKGYVISATGDKMDWLKDNVSIGDILYYDSYTKRLFVCDENGDFDPYFSKEFSVEDFQNYAYSIVEEEGTDTRTDYTYGISIVGNGNIVERGGIINEYDDGTSLFATTEESRDQLIMYAPIGAHCVINDGIASITFDKSRLDEGLEQALKSAMMWRDVAAREYDYVDFDAFDALIAEADELLNGAIDYKSYADMMTRLTEGIEFLRTETEITELRSAFHKPDEKTPTEVRATVLSAKAAGLNSLVLRVSNGYGTFIPMPEGSKFKQDDKFGGFDVLQSYIEVCKEENISLTLCIDVYYNEFASIAASDWLSVANTGDAGLSSKYFSPANIEFQNYFLEYVKHIISNYELDSVMFDYLRYPKFTETTDLGYDYSSIEAFSKEYGISMTEADEIKTQLFDSPHWSKWVEYKMGHINTMAKALCDTVRGINEGINLMVVAERDTVDYFYMQDSLTWISEGLFDGICLAMYESDADEQDPLGSNAYYGGIVADKGKTFAAYTGDKTFLFTGIETNSNINGVLLNQAINDSRLIGSDGFIFSSLDSFIGQNYHKSLSRSALRGSAVSPLGDIAEGMKDILEFSKHKIFEHIRVLGGCEEEIGLSALDRIDAALEDLENGIFSYEDAKKLEDDMSLLFAASTGKDSAIKEFKDLTKLALLSKERVEAEEPDTSEPETSVPTESEDVSEEASDISEESVALELSENTADTEQGYNGPDAGTILIYVFVGITAVAVIAAMIIGIKRKNTIDPNHHMPKGYEDKE